MLLVFTFTVSSPELTRLSLTHSRFRPQPQSSNAGFKPDDLKEPPLPGIQAAWGGSPLKVPLLKLKGNIPSHMLDNNSDSWNAAPSVEVHPVILEPC